MEKSFYYSQKANGHEIIYRTLLQELATLKNEENIDLESDQFHFYDIRKSEALHYASILRVDFKEYLWGCLGKPPCDWDKPQDDSVEIEIESNIITKDIILLPFAESSFHFFINDNAIIKDNINTTKELNSCIQNAKIAFEYNNSILEPDQQQEFNAFQANRAFDEKDFGKKFYFYVAESLQGSVQNIFEFRFILKR